MPLTISSSMQTPTPAARTAQSAPVTLDEPVIRFMIGGAMKAGTTALATYLKHHPAVALPASKEAHVFDAPDFVDGTDRAEVNRLFRRHFQDGTTGRIAGDATPVTIAYPAAIRRCAQYNPDMRWVILLRDPVDRAVSQYSMVRRGGNEPLPLLLAVLMEPIRLWGLKGAESYRWRRYSYVQRSRYSRQLDELFRHFPREQVLLLRSEDLRREPARVVDRVCAFLGLGPMPQTASYPEVFQGNYARPGRWSPGMIALRWRLGGERRLLARRHSFAL